MVAEQIKLGTGQGEGGCYIYWVSAIPSGYLLFFYTNVSMYSKNIFSETVGAIDHLCSVQHSSLVYLQD